MAFVFYTCVSFSILLQQVAVFLIKKLPFTINQHRMTIQIRQQFLFVLSLFICSAISAQDRFEVVHHYKPFEVELNAGYARPQGKGAKVGFLLGMEPRFNVVDKVAIGLRMEATAMARGYVGVNGTTPNGNGEAGLGLHFTPTVEYYFTNRLVRPFIGGGAGIYNFLSIEANSDNGGTVQIPTSTRFGGFARAGIEIWHLRAAFEYNLVGKTNNINNNYLGIKLGIVLGGGLFDEYKGEY